MVTLLRRFLRTLLSSGMTTNSGLPASANKIDSWTPPTWTMWVTPKISTVACSKDTDYLFSNNTLLSNGHCHTLFSLVADSLKTKLDIERLFKFEEQISITISPKSGPFHFRGVFWVGRFSTCGSKMHFPEDQPWQSWPKALCELATWVWFRIPQNIPIVQAPARCQWVRVTVTVVKTAAKFCHLTFESNPRAPWLRYHFEHRWAFFGLMDRFQKIS